MLRKTVLSSLICVFFSASGFAQEGVQGFYIGPKLNRAFIDGFRGSDEQFGLSATAGYGFGLFGFEFEHAQYRAEQKGFSNAHIHVADVKSKISTNALYGVLRSSGPWFLKARVGYLHEDIKASGGGVSVNDDDYGASFGVGFGFHNPSVVKNFMWEMEYTIVEDDVSALTVGVAYVF